MENENKLPPDFKAKIIVSDGGCFEWTRGLNDRGYAVIYKNRKPIRVSRLVYEYVNGETIDGLCVLHKCDNRKCINPDHLFIGTRGDNNHDRKLKGRSNPLKGIECGLSKLTEPQVLEIRNEVKNGVTDKVLAKKFNTAETNIWMIKNRKTWKHI